MKKRLEAVLVVCAALSLVLYFSGACLVQQRLLLDLNGDGVQERILLVWKRGSYGMHHPSWVEHDETGLSQHLYIYEKRGDGRYHPIWMSSALGGRVLRMAEGEEIPGTGRRSIRLTDGDGRESRWGWLSWGLVRIN